MKLKTATRARTAKAALVKLLTDAHEVPTDHYQITTRDVEGGRFTAKVDFLVAQPPFVLLDLLEAGWEFTDPDARLNNGVLSWIPSAEVKAEMEKELNKVGIVFEEQPGGVGYPKPAAAAAPVKSTAVGPTKMVHTIAASMPNDSRKDVIAACVAAGIAYGTARTQYQKWFSLQKK